MKYYALYYQRDFLNLCQVIEVKKLANFFPQFCLGNNSVRCELKALLVKLKEKQKLTIIITTISALRVESLEFR